MRKLSMPAALTRICQEFDWIITFEKAHNIYCSIRNQSTIHQKCPRIIWKLAKYWRTWGFAPLSEILSETSQEIWGSFIKNVEVLFLKSTKNCNKDLCSEFHIKYLRWLRFSSFACFQLSVSGVGTGKPPDILVPAANITTGSTRGSPSGIMKSSWNETNSSGRRAEPVGSGKKTGKATFLHGPFSTVLTIW